MGVHTRRGTYPMFGTAKSTHRLSELSGHLTMTLSGPGSLKDPVQSAVVGTRHSARIERAH
jgi:hypothetical protein